jgi:enamine deaminase RidA (YjgF/YER057c/UK114 family)
LSAGAGPSAERRLEQHPKVADGASQLLDDVFGRDKRPCRSVHGVASLPLGTPVELDVIFEVAP